MLQTPHRNPRRKRVKPKRGKTCRFFNKPEGTSRKMGKDMAVLSGRTANVPPSVSVGETCRARTVTESNVERVHQTRAVPGSQSVPLAT